MGRWISASGPKRDWSQVEQEACLQEPTLCPALHDVGIHSGDILEHFTEIVVLHEAPPLILVWSGHSSHWFAEGLDERFRYVGHCL